MPRITVKRIAVLVLLALILSALIAPAITLARAGGGHTSNSGSSRSSGGSSSRSSGSGGSALGGAALGYALGSSSGGGGGSFGGCCTFFVIIIIILVAYVMITRFFGGGGGSSGGDGGDMPDFTPEEPQSTDFSALKQEDPDFSEQDFYGRVNEMFLAIQKAWEARNMEPARRFLAEQQFQVLQDGVGEYVRNGQINKLDSIHIDKITPVSISQEGQSDYVKVMITASVIDYTVDERTGALVNPGVLGDGKTVKTFDEYWTLVRRVGAKTKADATIKKCPNCGGPVTDGNYVKCAYCGTMMNDPALDWVLLRIEQP